MSSEPQTLEEARMQIKILRDLFVSLRVIEQGTRTGPEGDAFVREDLQKVLSSIDDLQDDYQLHLDTDRLYTRMLTEADFKLQKMTRHKEEWYRAWRRVTSELPGIGPKGGEELADRIMAILSGWKDKGPPTGGLFLKWPLDREPIARLLALSLEMAAERIRGPALVLLNRIVCTEGCDAGVIYLSQDAPCHWDEQQGCEVYDHEYFTPLGDALIELYNILKGDQPCPTGNADTGSTATGPTPESGSEP